MSIVPARVAVIVFYTVVFILTLARAVQSCESRVSSSRHSRASYISSSQPRSAQFSFFCICCFSVELKILCPNSLSLFLCLAKRQTSARSQSRLFAVLVRDGFVYYTVMLGTSLILPVYLQLYQVSLTHSFKRSRINATTTAACPSSLL